MRCRVGGGGVGVGGGVGDGLRRCKGRALTKGRYSFEKKKNKKKVETSIPLRSIRIHYEAPAQYKSIRGIPGIAGFLIHPSARYTDNKDYTATTDGTSSNPNAEAYLCTCCATIAQYNSH